MFTVVRTTTTLSLDEYFIKHSAATFFVKVEGDGMEDHGIFNFGTAGQAAAWHSASAFRSPRYTTEWSDIPGVKT